MIRRSTAIAVLTLLLLGGAAAAGPGDPPLRVGRITVRTLDIFSAGEAESGWLYRTANALHVSTREPVIWKFLLFHEGEKYDPERLAETERNLRGLDFIKAVSVTAGAPHDGVVDVEVVTQDAWTTQPSFTASRQGGRTTWAAGIQEENLLGTGRRLDLNYDRGEERVAREFLYRDLCLFGPYWKGDFFYSNNSDGREGLIGIERPFVSVVTRWSTALLGDDARWRKHLYAGGVSRAEIERHHQEVRVQYGRALDPGRGRPVRLTVGFLGREDRFQAVGDSSRAYVPDRRSFRYAFIQGEISRPHFLKLNYVDRHSRYQDFDLGTRLALRLGVSPTWFGPDRTTGLARLEASQGRPLGGRSFVLGRASFETRLDGGLSNALLAAELRAAWHVPTGVMQTAVARLYYLQGWSLDRDVQFFADGASGLRGYRLYSYEGDRCLILNLEDRIFSGSELLRLVAPGAAVFVDAGLATPPGTKLGLDDLKGDAGIGLRLGIPRAPSETLFRVDCAWPFSPDPLGRDGPLFSFSFSQAF